MWNKIITFYNKYSNDRVFLYCIFTIIYTIGSKVVGFEQTVIAGLGVVIGELTYQYHNK